MLYKDYGTFGLVSASRKKAGRGLKILLAAAIAALAACFIIFQLR
jgi:hypothetical protein